MEPKTGLLILWILLTIQALTCRPTGGCNVKKCIDHTLKKMTTVSKLFHSKNGYDLGQWEEPISELDLKNLTAEEKRHKAHCGLHYMHKAVEQIYDHQSNLHGSRNPINITILTVLDRAKNCVAHTICKCTNMTEPAFSSNDTYDRKQWGGTVLNISVEFLTELLNVLP